MKKIIFTALIFITGMSVLTGCTSWIEEDPDSLVTDGMIEGSDDPDASAKLLVTGVYSKWINDMFRWGYFPRVLEQDADYRADNIHKGHLQVLYGGGGNIAGNCAAGGHNKFYIPSLQKADIFVGISGQGFFCVHSVGHPGCVTQIYYDFVRGQFQQFIGAGQSAYAGVKYAYGP